MVLGFWQASWFGTRQQISAVNKRKSNQQPIVISPGLFSHRKSQMMQVFDYGTIRLRNAISIASPLLQTFVQIRCFVGVFEQD